MPDESKSASRQQSESSTAIRVGVAIVENRGRILVGTRDLQTVLGGMHEFPGGKCLPQESAAACAIRECHEETGLCVDIAELLDITRHAYTHGVVELNFFLCHLHAGNGHGPLGSFQWVNMSELSALNFPDGNQAVITKLLNRQHSRLKQTDLA